MKKQFRRFGSQTEASDKVSVLQHQLLEKGPVGITHVNLKGEIVNANDESARLLGYPKNRIPGRKHNDPTFRITDLDGNPLPESELPFRKVMESGSAVQDVRHAIHLPDGTRRVLSINGSPLYDEQGKIHQLVFTFQDITRQEKLQAELRAKNRILDMAGRMAKVGGWELDVETSEVSWTPETYRIHEVPQDSDFCLKEAINYFHPEDRPVLEDALTSAMEKGKPYDLELRFTTARGRDLVVRTICTPLLEDGNVIKLQGTIQDITDQKKAELKVRALEKRNNALLDHSPLCHKIIDLDFNLLYMNASGFEMLNVDRDADILGKPYPFEFFPEICRRQITEHLQKAKESGECIEFETKASDSDGHEAWWDHTIVPVKNTDGSIEYLTMVSEDTTREKEMQNRLLFSERMDAVGQLAGGVAHDFNNQLTSILGYAELLLMKLDDSELERYVKSICRSAENSRDLTMNLLAFARKGHFQSSSFNMHEVIQHTCDMLKRSINKHIKVTQDLRAETSVLIGDVSLLQNALLNICLNARDAMPEGGRVTVATRLVEVNERMRCSRKVELRDGRYMVVSVSDTGSGIPPDHLSRVFEPFYTTKPLGKGTGMGLSAAHGTVKSFGGDLLLQSEVGKGTCVEMFLPLPSDVC